MDPISGLLGSGATAPVSTSDPIVIAASLLFTLVLMLVIGFTYQRTHPGAQYTQGFVQSLVLVGMVASLVLQIVGTNIAAAFAIFGAFSIIRYRSAVPETRDVGFVFFALAVGLAAGAALYALAAVATAVICLVIAAMTYLDLYAPRRVSHTLRVRVTNDVDFEAACAPAFDRYADAADLRRVESVQGGMLTEATYGVLLKPEASPHELVSALQQTTGGNRVVLVTAGPAAR